MVELGPGQGTMQKYILRITAEQTAFLNGLRLYLVESNTTLRGVQQELLASYNPTFIGVGDLNHLPPLPIIVVANEFFDTLPLRQYVRTRDEWLEQLIDVKSGRFVITNSPTREEHKVLASI